MRRTLRSATHGMAFPRGALVSLRRAQGVQITLHRGRAWLTQEGDPRDIVLAGGERFRLANDGRAVIQVLDDAEISFTRHGREQPPSPLHSLRRRARAFAAFLQGALHAARVRGRHVSC